MSWLASERVTLEGFLPGLDKALAGLSLAELEQDGNSGLAMFKDAGGAGLLVPTEHGGLGATALEAVRCTRAVGVRSPSLAVATTMHNFSVASLVALARHSEGFEWMLLDAVARDRLLVASAFAEGNTNQGILAPTMTARPDEGNWLISGRKRPCSLSRSMNLITASVALVQPDGSQELGVALIPADSPGITVRPFWQSAVLTGAESDEVVLEDVTVSDELIVRPQLDPGSNLDDLQTVGLVWFSLLVGASYLGAASALAERLLALGRGTPAGRAEILTELEGAAMALEHVASAVDAGQPGNDTLAKALIARYTAQGAIRRAVDMSVEMLGGIAFITAPDVSYLAATCHAVQFHPPARHSIAASLDAHFAGEALRVQ
ncbi:acyl-CoA dehydrogenase family protein [Streptomyces sp. NPDC006251]|uniref:acyl-CoA dehydrogenase family protein n=1 Tax=Streptomyces sp. NPDC006251 TaxID=3155718 RepID=UPI0033BCECF9